MAQGDTEQLRIATLSYVLLYRVQDTVQLGRLRRNDGDPDCRPIPQLLMIHLSSRDAERPHQLSQQRLDNATLLFE